VKFRHILIAGHMALVASLCIAAADDFRATGPVPALTEEERELIGKAVCGEGDYENKDSGVRCFDCPKFTGRAGSNEGLEISHLIRGRFTGKQTEELLLDLDGCEAHSSSYGGALLLVSATDTPSYKQVYYKPGFRLNDRLKLDAGKEGNVLVCNESDIAQGEVFGQVSLVEVSDKEISRKRLFRWYDNRAAGGPRVVHAVPEKIEVISPPKKEPARVQVTLRTREISRAALDKGEPGAEKVESLLFEQKGKQLAADKKTQQILARIDALIHAGSK